MRTGWNVKWFSCALVKRAIMKACLSLLLCGVLVACGGSPTATLAVSGAPSATLGAVSISFGSQTIDSTSSFESVTLTNTGTAALHIQSVAVGTPFIETNVCPPTLAIGSSCTINVAFAPIAQGDFSGDLSIVDNAQGSPHRVALSGTGTSLPSPSCTPVGGICGPSLPRCCAAPFPHHSICTSSTGFGRCITN